MNTHKLTKHGKGAGTWGECSCGMWCWLGTCFGEKRRTTELRAQHAEHVEYVNLSEDEVIARLVESA